MAAASIHHNPKDWQDIKGIQMEGVVSNANRKIQSIEAFDKYIKRFASVTDMITKPFSESLNCFIEQFDVRLYKLSPEKIVYLDNTIKFGFKIQLQPNLEVYK